MRHSLCQRASLPIKNGNIVFIIFYGKEKSFRFALRQIQRDGLVRICEFERGFCGSAGFTIRRELQIDAAALLFNLDCIVPEREPDAGICLFIGFEDLAQPDLNAAASKKQVEADHRSLRAVIVTRHKTAGKIN